MEKKSEVLQDTKNVDTLQCIQIAFTIPEAIELIEMFSKYSDMLKAHFGMSLDPRSTMVQKVQYINHLLSGLANVPTSDSVETKA